jgi:hypothetical protein
MIETRLEQMEKFVPNINTPGGLAGFSNWRTPGEQELGIARGERVWSHMLPGSVYIACIGKRWDAGVWERVVNLMDYQMDKGYMCWMSEMPESEYSFPNPDIPAMRSVGMYQGIASGAESTLFVDNDALVEPDLLCRLGYHQLPFIVPFVRDNDSGTPMGGPVFEFGNGVQQARWAAMSVMLVRNSVFNCPDIRFDAVGMEGLFFQMLMHYGHQLYIDTDVEVKTTRGPHRPGTITYNDRIDRLANNYDKRMDTPDRTSLDPEHPQMVSGIYLPKQCFDSEGNLK